MESEQFAGRIGRWYHDSEPWWPERDRAPEGAPNVVVVLLDDVGFAQIGPYGSDIDTPAFDRLAAGGVTFTNFHTTGLCSPTRACVLTGRNHHSVGMGRIIDLSLGFPGYDASISHRHGFLPAMLTPAGWAAYAVGKWHLTPRDVQHLGAPRTSWPLGRGFERYYGFFDGESHQFAPNLVHDNHQVPAPGGYADGYHLTADLVDHGIEYLTDLRNADPDKPFFLYVTPGACHSPHQAPQDYLDRYRGRFDEGWDVWRDRCVARQRELGVISAETELSPRPEWVPAWAELSPDERRVHARYMEAFAAMLTHTDAQVGRLVDFLARTGDLDNTIVMVLSDNGASSEGGVGGSLNDLRTWNGLGTSLAEALEQIDGIGGPTIHNNYPWGWTVAGNTPFRRWKREVHEGGVADPFILHWPARVRDPGTLRHQYCHAIDLVPTVLDACGIDPPATISGVVQSPIEGVSLLPVIDDAAHDEVRRLQYFEMLGCRALYRDGHKAVTYHPIQAAEPPLSDDGWELYDLRVDPSECHDLAAAHPDLLAEMIDEWWRQAEAHQVLPVDNRPFSEFTLARPRATPERAVTVLRPSPGMVPEVCAPDVRNRTHTVTASVDVGADGARGAIVSQGSGLSGWVLYADGENVTWHLNVATGRRTTVRGAASLAAGRHVVELRYTKTAELRGEAVLVVDGREVARGDVGFTHATRISMTGAGLSVGRADAYPVSDDPIAGQPFTGTIDTVVIALEGPPYSDDDEVEVAIAVQ
jgi:arylsulfatase A-like enzyme